MTCIPACSQLQLSSSSQNRAFQDQKWYQDNHKGFFPFPPYSYQASAPLIFVPFSQDICTQWGEWKGPSTKKKHTMMAVSLVFKIWSHITNSVGLAEIVDGYKPKCRCNAMLPSKETPSHPRLILVSTGVSLVAMLMLKPAWAGEQPNRTDDKDESVIGAIKSIFDPDEKTMSGKVLPKAYLKSAREVVNTLRQSLEEGPKDKAKFRRIADSAKDSIRGYLSNWRGKQVVVNEKSYVMLEKAIRALAGFYSKAGPSAVLSGDG